MTKTWKKVLIPAFAGMTMFGALAADDYRPVVSNVQKQSLPHTVIRHKAKETPQAWRRIKIRDVDLLAENKDASIEKNSLVREYIKQILDAPSLTQSELEWYIELMNKIPGYETTYMLRNMQKAKGTDLDSAELVLDVRRTKARLSVDANNYGARQSGKYQFSAFGQLLNPLGWNDSIILNGITTDKPKNLYILTAGYMKRLTSFGSTLSLLVSDMRSVPQTVPTHITQENRIYKGELEQYLWLNSRSSGKAELGVDRYEVKETGSTPQSYSYNNAYVGLKLKCVDGLGDATNQMHLIYSNTINSVNFKAANPGFNDTFGTLKINAFRDQPLGRHFSMFANITYQYSNDNLPLEQKFVVGGNAVGRGYKSGLISANRGIAGSLEARYTYEFNNNKLLESIQSYIFGELVNVSNTALSINRQNLNSWGGGIRLFTPFDVRLDGAMAAPFTPTVTVGGTPVKNNTVFSFFISKEFKI